LRDGEKNGSAGLRDRPCRFRRERGREAKSVAVMFAAGPWQLSG